MFLKMIQPEDFYYESKGKKNGKEMMPLEQKTLLRMEPFSTTLVFVRKAFEI